MNGKQIKLKNGIEVFLAEGMTKTCECGALMHFAKTAKGALMPVVKDENGDWVSHFSNCVLAQKFRKQRRKNE